MHHQLTWRARLKSAGAFPISPVISPEVADVVQPLDQVPEVVVLTSNEKGDKIITPTCELETGKRA